MGTTRKRTFSDVSDASNSSLDRAVLDQLSSGPSIPTLPSCLGSSRFLLRSGLSSDALARSHLPFAGTLHTLGQSINHRYSAQQRHVRSAQFRYSDSFSGHVSCVNALAISRGPGRWLASGGDDKTIHVRDLFVDLSHSGQTVPLLILKGHESNIFSIDWSAENKYLFSTGNDSQILYYDVEHSQMPIRGTAPSEPQYRAPLNPSSIGAHDDSVPELSAHPTNANLLLSCDDGGNLKLIDIRLPHDSVSAARSDVVAGFSSVQWNPNCSDGNTFAAATCGRITGSTRLYDVRQCFSSHRDRPLTSKDAVLSYHTALMQNSSTRGLIAAAAETNSLCFDPHGHFLASSISRYHPTIYAVNDTDPLATLESTVADDPIEDGYYGFMGIPAGTPSAPKKLSSCCTIKHGSFGLQAHTGKLHYAIGSDDFRAYVFEIPDRDELVRRREFVDRHEWIHQTSKLHVQRRRQKAEKEPVQDLQRDDGNLKNGNAEEQDELNDGDDSDSDSDMVADSKVDRESEVVYSAGSILRATKVVRPARLQQQAYVLCGSRSILNTALIHPTLPLIFTAGIVSEIYVHSAAPFTAQHLHPDDDDWDTQRRNKIGGTRPRFLLPSSSRSLVFDESDSNSDESDESSDVESGREEEEERDEEDAESVGEGSDHDTATLDGQDAEHQQQTQGSVQDFLSAMRNDPMYSTTVSLDYHRDRHISTYALSHLSPGIAPTDASTSSSDSETRVDGDADADPDADADTATTYSHDSHDGDEQSSEEEEEEEEEKEEDEDYEIDPYKNDGYGSPTSDYADWEIVERDEDVARDHEREYEESGNGPMWAVYRSMDAGSRDRKRMFLFDDLLRRDELRHLTAGFQKVPLFAGGSGQTSGFTCRNCEGSIDTDE